MHQDTKRAANEFSSIQKSKVSVKYLGFPIDKLLAKSLISSAIIFRRYQDLFVVKGGSIAIKPKILEKNLLHQIYNSPGIRSSSMSTILRFTAIYVPLFWEACVSSPFLCRQGDKYSISQPKHSQENVQNIENILNENLKFFRNAEYFVEKKEYLCK